MKRADLANGGVYAFKRARDFRYGNPWPVMIVDAAQLYLQPRRPREGEHLVTAEGHTPRQGDFHRSAVGYLSVHLGFTEKDPGWDTKLAEVRAEASIADATKRGLVKLESGLGAYELMTSLPHLHGDYLEVVKELAEREVRARQRERELAKAQSELRVRVLDVKHRFEAAGFDMHRLYISEHTVPTEIKFSIDQAERLLDLIEHPLDHAPVAGT